MTSRSLPVEARERAHLRTAARNYLQVPGINGRLLAVALLKTSSHNGLSHDGTLRSPARTRTGLPVIAPVVQIRTHRWPLDKIPANKG